jgi:hypothetical protein
LLFIYYFIVSNPFFSFSFIAVNHLITDLTKCCNTSWVVSQQTHWRTLLQDSGSYIDVHYSKTVALTLTYTTPRQWFLHEVLIQSPWQCYVLCHKTLLIIRFGWNKHFPKIELWPHGRPMALPIITQFRHFA